MPPVATVNDCTGLLASRENDRDRSYSSIDDEFDETPPATFFQRSIKLTEDAYNRLVTMIHIDSLLLSSGGLVIFTAAERVTFKMMIDRMLPYKFVLVEIIFMMACTLFSTVTLFMMSYSNAVTAQMRQFPHMQIFIMALLDTVQFILLVYSGAAVSPTMTVILMHTSTLFVVLGSKLIFPNRHYSSSHSHGLLLMACAIAFSLMKICYYDTAVNSNYSATYYAIVYVLAACLQGVSTLYKESALASWSRAINLYYLSAYLFLYQFFVTIAVSCLFYTITDFLGYSQATMQHSFYHGWMCFLGQTPSQHDRDDDISMYVSCHDSLWLIMGYVLSTFLVLTCLNTVLERNSQTVPRLLCVAIVTAFLVLWLYDAHFSQFQPSPYVFGGSVGAVDLLAMFLLVMGNEIYGRDPEPDVELITHYSPSTPTRNGNNGGSANTPSMEFIALTKDTKNMVINK